MSRGGGVQSEPLPPPKLRGGEGDTAQVPNRTKIHGKNVVCLFTNCRPHRHLDTFYLN